MKVCRCVVSYTCMFTRASWTWPRVVSQAPGQSSAGQGYNVCTFGSCFTSCLWPTLPQVQDWLAALDLGLRKDATPSFPHSFPSKLPQSACPGERRPPRLSTCSVLCSSSWTMTDQHLWIISIAGQNDMMTARHRVTVGLSFSETDTENHSFDKTWGCEDFKLVNPLLGLLRPTFLFHSHICSDRIHQVIPVVACV